MSIGCATLIGLARAVIIWCIYGIFGREATNYTVLYRNGGYVRLWPTLIITEGDSVGTPMIYSACFTVHVFTVHVFTVHVLQCMFLQCMFLQCMFLQCMFLQCMFYSACFYSACFYSACFTVHV